MTKEEKRNYIGNIFVEDDPLTDNLAIVLVSYFEQHINRPENDPIDDQVGWGQWAVEKANEALDMIVQAIEIMDYNQKIKILKMIADDMKNDAKNFDGRPFNGKTVAEYFGNQGAAIAALAHIIESILEKESAAVRILKTAHDHMLMDPSGRGPASRAFRMVSKFLDNIERPK